jgi:serine/threonine protein kinase
MQTEDVGLCPEDGMSLILDRRGDLIAGRYELIKLLGLGGSGSTVWEATQLPVNRPVALKFSPLGDSDGVARFERGAKIMASMSHPHIAKVHDYGLTPFGDRFLAMEKLTGVPLTRRLKAGDLTRAEMQRIVAQMLHALEHVHRAGIIHRDIKPDNVFVTTVNDDTCFAKLLDFGIARADGVRAEIDLEITQQRQITGTPEYMAPEQVVGSTLDHRADIYAVGICLFRMLTGVLPFDSDSRRKIYQAKLSDTPPTLSETAPDATFSDSLQVIITRCLRTLPAERYPSADDMREAVEEADFSVTQPE